MERVQHLSRPQHDADFVITRLSRLSSDNLLDPEPVICMQVHARTILFSDRGAMLLRTVQRLPALKDLDICYWRGPYDLHAPVSATHGLPCCKELAELRSASLVRLRVFMLDGPAQGNVLRLSGLPELRHCELTAGENGHLKLNIRITAASFDGTPQLEDLHQQGDRGLELQDGCFQQLTALTLLRVVNCGLRRVPAAVVSLGNTLQVLDLSDNAGLQIDAAAVAAVLQCSRLEVFGVYKDSICEWHEKLEHRVWLAVSQHMEEQAYEPAQLSIDSVKFLLQLSSAFRYQHGRDLLVVVDKHVQLDHEAARDNGVWPLPEYM